MTAVVAASERACVSDAIAHLIAVLALVAGCVAPQATPAATPTAQHVPCFRNGPEGPLFTEGVDTIDLGQEPDGDPAKNAIRGAVERQAASVKACHAKYSGAESTVVVQLRLTSQGAVSRAAILSSTLPENETASCIGTSICGWRFPATHADVTRVTLPFHFAGTRADINTRATAAPFTPDDVQKGTRSRLMSIKNCFEAGLQRDPRLGGKIVLHWTINLDGSTGDVTVIEDTMHAPEVALCMTQIVGRWEWPRPSEGPVDVQFPFVFKNDSRE